MYKCQFALKKVDYLGHIVSGQGIKADSSKLQAMLDWPTLKIVKILGVFWALLTITRSSLKAMD